MLLGGCVPCLELKLCYLLIGFSFPTLKESDAMFLSEKAPDWHDGEFCHRCRVQFGLVQRKVDHYIPQRHIFSYFQI